MRQLGKQSPVPDIRVPALHSILKASAALPPKEINWWAARGDWPMLANDRVGNCVQAGAYHSAQQRGTYNGREIIVPDDTVIDAYSESTGYVRGRPETDVGTVMSAFMEFWLRRGLKMPDGSRDRIDAYTSVDHTSSIWLRTALWHFGSLLIGLNLPKEAENFDFIWDYQGQLWVPGGWGGHCMLVVGCEATALGREYDCITWGDRVRLTERFLLKFIDEAWCVYDEDFLDARGINPAGVDRAGLLQAMATIRAAA